jgi:uncharacterized protein YlxW (UPF0749 family)
MREAVAKFLRPSRAQLAWGIALCLVALAVVIQVQSTQSRDRYATMRGDDLVQLLDGLTQESERLTGEVTELERTLEALRSGADADEIARQEAQRRADGLAILAGTVPAVGPGVRITISAPEGNITADLMLDAIQELRDAGAEVIEVNDSIRLVAQSWVTESPQGLLIDDQLVELPIVIEAIGDSHSLAEGARFRGGLVSQVESQKVAGSVAIEELPEVEITSLHQPRAPRYAQPA